MSTFSKRVAASADDAEETVSSTVMSLGSSDLELVHDVGAAQLVGCRFNSVTIPRISTINTATLTFQIDAAAGSTTATVKISGEDADDAGTYTTTNADISGRSKTTASTNWVLDAESNSVDVNIVTDDIASSVQEIVDRAGWTSGNDMAFIIETVSGTGFREVESYDGESTAAPLLDVDYVANTAPTVALNTPADASSGSDSTPTLDFTGTDADAEDVRYNVQIDTANTFDSQVGAEIVDETNTSGAIGVGWGDSGSGRDFMCQGFIPTLDNVTAVSFWIASKSANANIGYAVWIDAADASYFPTGTVYVGVGGFTEITNASLTTGSLVKYTLSSAVTGLTPGNRYVICFAPYNTSTNAWAAEYIDWRTSVSNPYANGRRVQGDSAFTNWTAPDSGNADIQFEVYGNEKAPLLNEISGTDSGFANPDNGGDTDPFTSGENIQFTVQAGDALSVDTYYWRVRGIDPNGGNSYGAWSSTRSFDITSGGANLRRYSLPVMGMG